MRKDAIYFPFIDVPNSTWFSRVLLYWETVSSIVPFEFVEEPEKLTRHTRDLIRVGLVKQIVPGDYLPQIHDQGEPFLEYVEQLGEAIASRRRNFALRRTAQIHIEKLHWDVTRQLERLGLADDLGGNWISVEKATANDYMAYLAGAIGQAGESPLAPITDSEAGLSAFASDEDKLDVTLDAMRIELLEEAFPAPRGRVSVRDIDSFKQRHGGKLGQFRNWLETELTDTAAISDARLRMRRLDLVKTKIREETRQIRETMQSHGWIDPICGNFCAVLGAVDKRAKLVNAVYKATRRQGAPSTSPLAYAAYAQDALGLGEDDRDQ